MLVCDSFCSCWFVLISVLSSCVSFVFVGVHWCLLVFVGVCWYLLVFVAVGVCWCLLVFIGVSSFMFVHIFSF